MAFRRQQYDTLVERLQEPPKTLTFVTGPRQTGKTTLIGQVLGDSPLPSRYVAVDELSAGDWMAPLDLAGLPAAIFETALAERDARWLARVWMWAREQASRSERGFVLALDEIQKIRDWSAAVKGLWDADRRECRPLRVVLAGSAPIGIQRGLSESLAGRFETIPLTHWSFTEMAEAFGFDLPRYIYFGGYPKVAEHERHEARWRHYVRDAVIAPNIERDILAMQRIDKPALLRQLFELGTEYSGQILAYNKMLGRLQDAGNTTTLARYADLLAQSGLLAGLDKHRASTPRRRASSPKWNTLNTGLMTALSDYTFVEAQADRSYWGRLVESAVGAHLCNTAGGDIHVAYWREGNHEVDFVLRRGRHLLAIEVKTGARPGGLSGFGAFAKHFPHSRSLLVGATGVPVAEFLSQPAVYWFNQDGHDIR